MSTAGDILLPTFYNSFRNIINEKQAINKADCNFAKTVYESVIAKEIKQREMTHQGVCDHKASIRPIDKMTWILVNNQSIFEAT